MSKEYSDAFGLIKRTCELYIESASYLKGIDIVANQINEALDTIQNLLDALDTASLSEAWECLEKLGKHELKQDCLVEDLTIYDTIKYALLKAQKLNIENSKYKQLEKEKGCPLEVYSQIITGRKNLIYDELGEVCVIKFIKDDYITVDIRFKGTFNFKISDYKKTWWLREDMSE